MNRTIDDTYGDPITGRQVEYSSNWHAGQNCSVCTLSPSQAQAVEGTWHDTTSNNPNSTTPHTATIRFNGLSYLTSAHASCEMFMHYLLGTAIWVYGIVVNYASQGIIIFTNASFELDGISLKNFEHEPQPEQDQYIYNVLLSSETGLDDTEHTLVMSAVQGANTSLLLFDYAVYTLVDHCVAHIHKLIYLSSFSYDDSKPSSASNTLSMTSTSSLSSATASKKPTSSSTNDLRTHHGELQCDFEIPPVLTLHRHFCWGDCWVCSRRDCCVHPTTNCRHSVLSPKAEKNAASRYSGQARGPDLGSVCSCTGTRPFRQAYYDSSEGERYRACPSNPHSRVRHSQVPEASYHITRRAVLPSHGGRYLCTNR